MAAVRFQPQSSLTVRNTFLHCAEEEESPAAPSVVRPRSRTGPASLFANMLLEAGLDDAPQEAKAAADSQASEAACSTSETGEWDDDERPFPIRSVRSYDFFEDAPQRSVSVRTLDPFDDAPVQEMTREQFQHAVRYEAPQPPPPPARHEAQAPGGHAELGRAASRTDEVASATLRLRAGVVAKIRIRNTFVDFLSDDEGDETPSLRSGLHRRARATRTVPARILEGALWHEDFAAEQGAPATPPESTSPRAQEAQSHVEGLQAAQPQERQQLQRRLRDDEPATTAAKLEGEPGVAAAAVEQPVLGPALSSKATTPEPMYVEQTPSTLKATPKKLRLAEQAEVECRPRLTVSVRNTFLHVDDEAEGAEQTPVFHHRVGRRSKTGPAGMLVLDDVSDESDEAGDRMAAAAASQPCKVPVVHAQPKAVVTTAPAQMASTASGVGMAAAPPPGVCVPFSLPPGVVTLAGFGALAPFLAQLSAAQAVQLCQPVAPQTTSPPKVEQTPAKTSAIGSSSRRSNVDRTTVVLQNLPLNYRRAMLLRMLDAEGFAGDYDFVYLPMDFKTRAGFGYAFINLADPSVVARFWSVFDGYSKWVFPSAKVCKVSWSVPHQGLKAHIKRYRNSPLMHESVPDEYKPVLFAAGTRVAFPPPMKEIAAPCQKVLTKAPKRGRK